MDTVSVRDALGHLWAAWGQGARPLHVVDVGANPVEGEAPYRRLLDRGYATVTGFEPQPEALAQLNAKKTPAETYLPLALGDGGTATLHLYRGSGFASVFPIRPEAAALLGIARQTRESGRIDVATRRLDDLAEVAPVDFLKIDVQGSELSIIANGAGKLAGAAAVMTEVRLLPIYQGEPSFGALDQELSRQGFMFHDFVFLKRMALRSSRQGALRRRTFRQVVDGDALYIRDLTRLDAVSNDQLYRLAILAEGVMQSPSLALFCLEELARREAVTDSAVEEYVALLPAEWRRQ